MLELTSKKIPKWRLGFLSAFGGLSIGLALFSAPAMFSLPPDRPGCDAPIHWSLGHIDERFPFSEKRFRSIAFEAEEIWESAIGKELFVFDDSSAFEIKTLYDERQEMAYEGQDLDEAIAEYEEVSESLQSQYDSLRSRYEKLKTEYDMLKSSFEKDLSSYEWEVDRWNRRGGAPDEIFEDLQEEKKSLEERSQELNDLAETINSLIARINSLADSFNAHTEDVNVRIETFREKYGEPKPFIQGLYEAPLASITVFQFIDSNDLRMVLAHELGHALGIEEHVSDPNSLMHYLMDQQDILDPKLSQEDIDAYAAACPEREFSAVEKLKRYLVLTPWKEMAPRDIIEIFQ